MATIKVREVLPRNVLKVPQIIVPREMTFGEEKKKEMIWQILHFGHGDRLAVFRIRCDRGSLTRRRVVINGQYEPEGLLPL